MKFLFPALALSLFPASTVAFSFAPSGSRTFRPASTSLQVHVSWLDRVLGNKSKTAEDEEQKIISDIDDVKFKKGLEELAAMDDKIDDEDDDRDSFVFDHMPTKEMTGVDEHITRLCATMAQQCYELSNQESKFITDEFKLNTKDHKAVAIITEMQGVCKATNPTFGAAITGNTMILSWRGTTPDQYPMDALNDIAFSPSGSLAWRKHAKSIKLHGAMASLTDNDIANHEDVIIEACKNNGIKEIVTTGHSLGGALGQIAHTIIRAQMQDENSPWFELKNINVRSVVFSAPMTTCVFNDKISKETEAFVEELNNNSCNLFLGNDVVPRAYGFMSFENDMLNDVIETIGNVKVNVPTPWILKQLIKKRLIVAKSKEMNDPKITGFVKVCLLYTHPGKLVYYKDIKSEPEVLVDLGPFKATEEPGTFRSVKYKPVEKGDNPINHVGTDWHSDIVRRPGIAFLDSELS